MACVDESRNDSTHGVRHLRYDLNHENEMLDNYEQDFF